MEQVKKTKMGFLKDFHKELRKMEGVGTSSQPPRYWYGFGCYVLNKIMSGSFFKGMPQGRVTILAGASGAGKSYLAANATKSAQKAGAHCLVIDSENALDDEFMTKIGVDVTEDYTYADVITIPQVTKVVSSFLQGYKKDYGEDPNAPPVFILIDSLGMLLTETEQEHYSKGKTTGDQGQRNKQLKAMLRTFVQAIKKLNVVMVCTSSVYKNQDLTNGEGMWIVPDAVKWSASQIVTLSKLKLKDEVKKTGYAGIRMKAEGHKTRFCMPFQVCTVMVPYTTGMDQYSGLIEVAMELGVLAKKGSYVTIVGSNENWYARDIATYADDILLRCEAAAANRSLLGTYISNDDYDDLDESDFINPPLYVDEDQDEDE